MRAFLGALFLAAIVWGCASSRTVFEKTAAPGDVAGVQLFHVVRPGETLYHIARTYGVPLEELARANDISDSTRVAVGQRILIPSSSASAAPPPQPPPAPKPEHAASGGWVWPVDGPLTSRFGGRSHGEWHTGIDITAPAGATVRAARDGEVTFAGSQGRYGRLVILVHGGGITSWYAHLRDLLVKPGDVVRQGDPIGRIGATGNATGPHLHLEIRRDGKPLDPLTFLP